MEMDADEFQEAMDGNEGFCTGACQEFTADSVEPDAEGYRCPVCRQMTVCGAEQALIMGHIEIT